MILFLASLVAGACAAISGFGIGSILTPLLSVSLGTKTAVALVSIPHFLATLLRFWIVKSDVDWRVFKNFGIASAFGGLSGAFLYTLFQSRFLALFLATLLIFVGIMGALGRMEKFRLPKKWAWPAGFVSGIFGGLVGNQGSVRSASLLGFEVSKRAFVATSTAVALIVDGARMPVYIYKEADAMIQNWPLLIVSITGIVVGTLAGFKLLKHIPEKKFKFVLSLFLIALGIFMLLRSD